MAQGISNDQWQTRQNPLSLFSSPFSSTPHPHESFLNGRSLGEVAEEVDKQFQTILGNFFNEENPPSLVLSKDIQEHTENNEDNIPREIWGAIFTFHDKPWNLRLVCKRWNQIVLHTPQVCKQLFHQAFGYDPLPRLFSYSEQFKNTLFNINMQIWHPIDQKIYPEPNISLLWKNILFTCSHDSEDKLQLHLWNISSNPSHLISTSTIDGNCLQPLLIGAMLFGIAQLFSPREIISIVYQLEGKYQCLMINIENGATKVLFTLENQKGIPFCLDIKQRGDRHFVAVGFSDGKCEMWDLTQIWGLTQSKYITAFKFNQPVTSVCLNLEKHYLIVGFENGYVQIWDIASQEKTYLQSKQIFNNPIKHLSYQGNLFVVGSKSKYGQEDEVKWMPLHAWRDDSFSFSLPEIIAMTFYEKELIIAYKNPLRIKKIDFSISDRDFFLNSSVNILNSFWDTQQFFIRLHHLPPIDKKHIFQAYSIAMQQKDSADIKEEKPDFDLECFLQAIHTYYKK